MINEQLPLFIVLVKGWVRKGDTFLFGKRSEKEAHAGGDWGVPGGKVEKEISTSIIETTLKKEIEEEVGVVINNTVNLFYNNTFLRSSGHVVLNLSFVCDYESGEAKPLEDTTEVKWLNLNEAEKLLPKYLEPEILSLKEFLKN